MYLWSMVCGLFLFSLNVTAPAALANHEPSELARIVGLEQRDADAARINDVDALVALWTDDGVLLMPGSEPIVGKPAIKRIFEKQKEQSQGIQTVSYDENWVERRIDGDNAWEWGSISVTMQLPNAIRVSQKVFMIRVLSRQSDGTWKFARAIGTPAPKAIH